MQGSTACRLARSLAPAILSVLLAAAPALRATECVTADDVYAAPQADLAVVDLVVARILPATLPSGDVALLSVQECSKDRGLDVWIPWSEGTAKPPAVIEMSEKLCRGNAPQRVEVTLRHYASCDLRAIDDSGVAVDGAVAAPGDAVQTLVLESSTGIRKILVHGAEICIIRICWDCELPPVDESCVSADQLFDEPKEDLAEVNLGWASITPATIPGGPQALLAVRDCNEDGSLDVWVPSSDASAAPPATILMSPNLCLGKAPQRVEVTLRHYASCTLTALDDGGSVVDTATAGAGGVDQTLVLESPAGIRRIVIAGAEICIVKICWECEVLPPADDCVAPGDFYAEPAMDLPSVNLGWATVTPAVEPTGKPSLLDIRDCTEDGTMDLWIHWSDVTADPPATIRMSPNLCLGKAPQQVEVTLRAFGSCELTALDEGGVPVDAAVAVPGGVLQTLVLQSPSGIRTIVVHGIQVCIVRICWECEAVAPAGDCVSAGDVFAGPVAGLPVVNLGSVAFSAAVLPTGGPALLEVRDCSEDGALDVWIPWSEGSASPPARIRMSRILCDGKAPQRVEVTLRQFASCKLVALDEGGMVVDSEVAAAGPALQTLVLESPAGIRNIIVVGAEICIVRVCWRCEVPPPQDDCVTAGDLYAEPAFDLPQVNLGWALITPATLPSGDVSLLDVRACAGAGALGVWIPWSEGSANPPAKILMSPNLCQGDAPQRVEVTVIPYASCKLTALDEGGVAVDTALAAPGAVPQTLVLYSPAGIRTIVVDGAEICIARICWRCESLPDLPIFQRGDANADGRFDISDAVATLGTLFLGEIAPPCLDAADGNDDGDFNITDAIYELNFLFLGGSPIPAPYPECGADETADPLDCGSYPEETCA